MITQEQNFESYQKLNVWIPKIIECLETETIDDHVFNFLDFVINLFYWISNKEGKANVAMKYKSILSEKIQKHLTIDKDYPHTSIDDDIKLADLVNYVPTWIKNNFDVDIENINLIEIQSKNILKLESTKNEKKENVAMTMYKNIFNKNWSNEDIEHLQENKNSTNEQQAKNQLEREISKGKIYIYKTRPKWNPVIKNIMCVLLGIGIITSVMWFIFSAANIITTSSSGRNYWSILAATLNLFFFIYSMVEIAKNNQNDNFKYLFDKSLISYQLISLISHAIFVALTKNLEQPSYTLTVSLIPLHAVVFIMNTYGVFNLNPEKNNKLINDLSTKYSEDKSDKCKYN